MIYGGSGSDSINGDRGNDCLIGGDGRDILTDAKGADQFFFDVTPGVHNIDTVTDFGVGNDLIDLSRSVFAGIGAKGELHAKHFVASGHAQDASDRILYDEGTGKLFYDSAGTGDAGRVLFAKVTPGTHLDHTDFVVVA